MGLFSRIKDRASKIKNYGKQTYDYYLGFVGPLKSKKQLRHEQNNLKKAARTAKLAGRRSFNTETGLKKIARAVEKSGNPKVEALRNKVDAFAATKRGDQVRRIAQGYAAGYKRKGAVYDSTKLLVEAIQGKRDEMRHRYLIESTAKADQEWLESTMAEAIQGAHEIEHRESLNVWNPRVEHSPEFVEAVAQGKIAGVTLADITPTPTPTPTPTTTPDAACEILFEPTTPEAMHRAEAKNKLTKIKRSTGSISRSAQNMFYAATKTIWNRPGVTDKDAAIMEAFGVKTTEEAMEIVFHEVSQRSGKTTDDLMQPFAEVEYLEEIIQELNAFYMRLT